MDGGSSLHILYAETLSLMGMNQSRLRNDASPVHGVVLGIEPTLGPDMTIPPSKMSQAPSQATSIEVSPTTTPAQVIDGPITRSRAKKLQQEVHALLCEIHFNINENYILPKCCTLIVLRYIEEEKEESNPEERTSASSRRIQKQTMNTCWKARRVYVPMNLVATSLDTPYCLQTRISTDCSEGQQSVVTEYWYNLPSKTVPIYKVSCWLAYIAGKLFESSLRPKKRFIIWTSQ